MVIHSTVSDETVRKQGGTMFDEENEKLKNLMKLKEEMEKDLEKKGIFRGKRETQKTSAVDETVLKKLRENVVVSAQLKEEESLTFYNINAQDYGSDLEAIEKAVRNFQIRTSDANRRIIFEGLLSLLNGEFEKAKRSFSQVNTVEAHYDMSLAKLYNGEDISNDIAQLLKGYSDSIYPLLLLLESELLRGSSLNIEKVLTILARRSLFWNLISSMYTGTADEETINKAIRERIFSSLVLMLSVYIDSSRDYPMQSHTCLNVHKAYLRGETIQAPNWCLFGQLASEARKYLAGYKVDLGKLKKFERAPETKLFLGFLFYNDGNYTAAQEYFKKFEMQVDQYTIYGKPLKQSKIGIEQFTGLPRDFAEINMVPGGIFETIQSYKGYDFYVYFKNLEFVRLVFSEEHCKINYKQ